jgi:hypothetical protein
LVLAGFVLVVLTSCGYATTAPATWVTDVGARLTGTVHSTETGTTRYHFEYGPTTAYGSTTEIRTVTITNPEIGVAVTADVAGLAEGTVYHHRLCAYDVGGDGAGTCSADATLTTSSGQDSVTGSGWLILSPVSKVWIGSELLDARSAADGSGATGRASADPGPLSPFFRNHGSVTCLRVSGNRAAIGFVTDSASSTGTPMMVFVEDNGPSGDRWGREVLGAPATSCPEPVEANFAPFLFAGLEIPSTLTVGDFTVHDHPSP